MFDPKKVIGRDLDRRDLHLVDWDGDGVCDIVWTDPANQNRPHVWRNRYKETGNFDWQYEPNPAPDLWCPEQRGLGFFDRPVHLADISGNRRADYLCVEKDGRAWGFVQSDVGIWEHIDQFKFSEEKDRANLYWADVNGDGRADMIHTNKFNGDGTVWLNKGSKDVGGSRFEWEPLGARFAGAAAGACTYYPDLDGNGRADMHVITHSLDNTAKTWFSRCGRPNKVGNDGIVSDPHLPVSPDGTDEDPDGGKDLEWSDYFPEDDEEGLDYDFEGCHSKYGHINFIPDTVDRRCAVTYLLETLLVMLESDIRNYTEILDDSYDKKFNTYSKAVVEGAPQFVHEFRMNNGTDYFNCIAAGPVEFCSYCYKKYGPFSGFKECRYCTTDINAQGYINVTEPCPPDTSLNGLGTPKGMSYWWSFKNGALEDQFYKDLEAETGVPRELTQVALYWKKKVTQACLPIEDCKKSGVDFNVPIMSYGYGVDDVVNPKDIITSYLGELTHLRTGLRDAIAMQRMAALRSWVGSDMVDVVSVPVLMIRQAVESMAQVIDIAEEIEAAKRKEQILFFISAFLFLIPIGGQAIGTIARLANIGRFISLAGGVVMAGFDIYSVVEDPASALFVIFGYTLGAGALKDSVRVNKAAAVKRGVKDDDMRKLGDIMGLGMRKIDTILRTCK
ncbi:hypothetical protein BDV12DRAFT_204669 [Aspergillus spectabilis]